MRGEEEDDVKRKMMRERERRWLFGEDDGDKRKMELIKIIEKKEKKLIKIIQKKKKETNKNN